jgi:hypothetical protein
MIGALLIPLATIGDSTGCAVILGPLLGLGLPVLGHRGLLSSWGKVDWNFTFYGNWDNRPPPGFTRSDYGTTSGLSWTFGNR